MAKLNYIEDKKEIIRTSKWNVPYGNWGIIYSSLQIIFEGRV